MKQTYRNDRKEGPRTALRSAVAALSLAWLAALIFMTSAQAQQVSVTAELSPTATTPGQAVSYILTYEGGQPQQLPQLNLPQGLTIVGQVSQSNQISIVNGAQSITMQLAWPISAQQVGEFTIPAPQVVVNGQAIAVNEVKLSVTASGQATADTQVESDPILQLSVAKTEFYVGEMVPVTAVLYIPRNISVQRMGLIDANNGDFAIQRFPQQPEQSTQRLGNRTFTALTFRSTLSALKAGNLKLGPAKCELILGIPTRGGRGNIFGLGMMQMQQEKRIATAVEIAIKALPLPEKDRPKNFSGAVGDFTIATTTSNTSVTVGEPVNVEITISGQGNFDAIAPPTLSDATGWKPYPPRRFDMNPGDANTRDLLNRSIGFSSIIVPEKVMPFVPSFELSFFNPQTAKYVVLRSPPISIAIAPGAAVVGAGTTVPGGAAAALLPAPTLAPVANISDILLHLPSAPHWAAASLPPLRNTGFLAFNAVLFVVLLGLISWVSIQRAAQRRAASAELRQRTLLRAVEDSAGNEAEFYRRAVHYIHSVCPGCEGQPELRGIMERYETRNFMAAGLVPSAVDAATVAEVIALLRHLRPSEQAAQAAPSLTANQATAVAVALLAALSPATVMAEKATPSSPPAVAPAIAAERYAAAVKALEAKDYIAAEKQASSLVEAGAIGPEVFEIIGHARYKQDKPGDAALWYQRARLFPGLQPEVQQNLRHISERIHFFAPQRDALIDGLASFFSTSGWAYLAASALWLAIFSGAYLVLAPGHKTTNAMIVRKFAPLATGALVVGVLVTAIAVVGWNLRPSYTDVVDLYCVTATKAQARTAATATSGSVIPVPPGSIIRRLNERGAWSYVEIAQPGESLRGWLESESLVPLWPYDAALLP